MIFLFEQHSYTEEYLDSVLPLTKGKDKCWDVPKGFVSRSSSGEYVLDGVGYLFNGGSRLKGRDGSKAKESLTNRIVFVLPKVFLDESGARAFGQIVPTNKDFVLKDAPKDFLANLSLWVSSSIGKYREANPADSSANAPDARGFSTDDACPTLVDVKNAMERFYEENKSLFVFVSKNVHSGNNRIDWRRTMRKTPFMLGDSGSEPGMTNGVPGMTQGAAGMLPIYMELENKKKVFDLDDRLIVLYFSAMNYIHETFGFKMPKSEFYAPIRVNEFRRMLGHKGLMELRRIKHKYFADKFLRLYNIMKAFFEWGGNFKASDFTSEYLLTSKYNNVFEYMIDTLVGDEVPNVQKMKNLDDGKIIDHLYKEKSLIFSSDDSEKIWHIGDSKYYTDPADIRGESIAKQFTYAKNIIQDFFSPKYFGSDEKAQSPHEGVRYRDELTEGYSITPNFFIRGDVEKDNPCSIPEVKASISDAVEEDDMWGRRNRQFQNRLFDRDTLLLQVYNVNFPYVLKAFTAKSSGARTGFRDEARRKFRKNFMNLLDQRYCFWAVYLNGSDELNEDDRESRLKTFVDAHFRVLVGHTFQPKGVSGCLILALEKDADGYVKQDKAYEQLRPVIEDNCEIYYLKPEEIWESSLTRSNQRETLMDY